MDEISARVLCHQLFLSPPNLTSALQYFGSASSLLHADVSELGHYFQTDQVNKIIGCSGANHQTNLIKNQLESQQVTLLAICDSAYPSMLAEIPGPPALLYVQGDVTKLSAPQIAIVGSRKMTPLGGNIAKRFASDLVSAGITITSGLALGIDACAHQGVLQSDTLKNAGSTIAVLGTGIDGRYPRSNQRIYREIVDMGGVLVSEYPMGTPPKPENFPRRNRIITGLSMATLVVEASEKSGSVISAKLAADQGRPVFAIPGCISSASSSGCHRLIREGATLVTEPSHILEDVCPMLEVALEADPKNDPAERNSSLETEHWLLDALGHEMLSIDDLCLRCQRSVQEITAAVTELELSGAIESSVFGYQRITN